MQEKLQELKTLLQEAHDLNSAASVLYWDQSTYMPRGGAEARGRQLAIVSRIEHEFATNPRIGELLDALQPYAESLPADHDDAAFLRVARRDFERNTRVPASFVAELSEHLANAYMVWAEARPASDFARVLPYLEKTLDFSRRQADFFPGYDHIADPLIDHADYGMKASDIRHVFSELREGLVPIIRRIAEQPPADDSVLRKHYPKELQLQFSEAVARDFGYDFNRGRMDLTHHPFEVSFSLGDTRITTRVKEDYLGECMFSVFHESGHAMYEQGGNPAYEGTPLRGGTSAGVHESQSRTWENIVGRSRAFWQHYYPRLQAVFPEQLNGVDLDTFYRAVNKVERSLIRTDADEVTYNLHPMIRFDLELALLEGSLALRDLPEAWNARYESDLGITPPDHNLGVMQDVHWFGGIIGGSFQGYTLGNILSAMFYEQALKAHPEIPEQIGRGEFDTLHGWLKDNIYQYGSKYTAPELIQRVAGGGLDVNPLLRYLRTKYGELYSL
jgi:carboxypeptidase Taq